MGPLEIFFIVLGISILIIVHETGHYLAARAFGMRVVRYSIGIGPTLFKYQPKGSPTTFQVAAIPFLAYVQIAGMNPHEELDADDPEIFQNASLTGRIVTVAAGPFANYLAACLIAFFVGLVGWPSWIEATLSEPARVGEVNEESPAQVVNLQAGDIIVQVDGEPTPTFSHVQKATQSHAGEELTYRIRRGTEEIDIQITPQPHDAGDGRTVGIIGVRAPPSRPYSIGEAATAAVAYPWRLTTLHLTEMARMAREMDSSGLGGPVAMGEFVGSATQGGPTSYFASIVFLSVALGLFNLLPFPALDGGRLVFLMYELVTRQRPNERLEMLIHTVGIIFLLGVLVLVTFRDVSRLFE